MKVSEIMSGRVQTVSPNASFRDLWRLIFKKRIHSLPVVDAKGGLLGIVTQPDLLRPLYPDYQHVIDDFISASDFDDMEERIYDLSRLTAKDVMNTHVIFTRGDSPVMRALSRMIVRRVRQLPVLSENDTVIGIITQSDIFDALFRRHLQWTGLSLHKKGVKRQGVSKRSKRKR